MSEQDDIRVEYEGYTDLKTVSNRVGVTIDNAVDACASIDALHAENARVRPQTAAQIRRDIMAAALMLIPDLEGAKNGQDDDPYEKILDRWGVGEEGAIEEGGFLGKLKETNLQKGAPDWILQLGTDIRRAGWELGYLRAGRMNKERDLEEDERQAVDMFS